MSEASAGPDLYGCSVFHQMPAGGGVPAGAGDVAQRAFGVGRASGGCRSRGRRRRRRGPTSRCRRTRSRCRAVRSPGYGRVAGHRAQAAVQVALGARREARHRAPVGGRRRGDRDRVERLEQRHDVPDRGQRIAVAVAEPRVVPAQRAVVPACLRERDAAFGERQVVLLGGAEGRRRALTPPARGAGERGRRRSAR